MNERLHFQPQPVSLTRSPFKGHLFQTLLNEHLWQNITLQVDQRPSPRPVSLSGRGLFYGFLLVEVNTVEAHYNPSAGQEQKRLAASPRAAG